ncbi:TrbI F-type domain-containing protein [Sphingomonas oryzagri]
MATDAGSFVAASPPSPSSAPWTFAGFRLTTLLLVAIIFALACWNIWTTRELLALKHRRIVSVSLATLITDFVRNESHQSGDPQQMAAETRRYLVATQLALKSLAGDGTPVVASEAVLGNSVPDVTPQVKQAVARAMAADAANGGGGNGGH